MYSLTFVSPHKTKFEPLRDALLDYPQLGEIQDAQNLSELIQMSRTSRSVMDMVMIDLTHEISWEMTISMINFKMMFPKIEMVALVDTSNINFILSCINYGATGLLQWGLKQSQVLAEIIFQALERKGAPLSPALATLLISQFHYSKNLERNSA